MPNIKIHRSNFNGGFLTPGFAGRSDLAVFQNGAQTLINWANLVPGGIRRRPGTRFRYNFGTIYTRIEPFSFNEGQRYLICFQPTKFLVIDPATWNLLTTVTGCPWASVAEIDGLRYTQRADVMVVVHQNFEQQLIRRTGASTFTIEDFPWETDISGWPRYSPQYKIAQPQVTLLPSAVTGSIDLTTSEDHWTSGHVGVVVEYRGSQIEITAITSTTVAVGTVRETLDESYTITATNADDFTIGETIFGKDSSAKAEVIDQSATTISVNQQSSTFEVNEEIEGLTSGTVGEVSSVNPTNPLATDDWTEEAFSAAQGYPKACVFHGGRLWFGGSTALPASIFGSNAQAFFKFDVGDAFPSDSIADVVGADNVHQIEHLHAGRQLQIMTDQGAFYAPESENKPLTPEDMLIRRISWYGITQARPIQHEASTLMAQDDSPLIREILWNELQQNFDHDSINYQSHTLNIGTKEIVMADSILGEMEPYAMFLQSDGTITVWTGVRRENLSAWTSWQTRDGDTFESLANLDGKIIAATKRVIDGQDNYFLESFDFEEAADCTIYSDVLAEPGSVFTGFGVTKKEPLSIVAPVGQHGYYLGDLPPVAGTLDVSTLTGAAFPQIRAGFNYTATVEPMPVSEQLPSGDLRGRRHRIVSATLALHDSLDFQLTGNVFRARNTNDDPSLPPELFTGDRRFHMFGWGQRQSISIVSDVPLPAKVLSITYEVAF